MPIARSVRMTRTAISPRLATRTVSNIVSTPPEVLYRPKVRSPRGPLPPESPSRGSHPEDAVAEFAQRCVGARGEGETEHGAGLRGVDHAVVPEAGGGVVRVALVLVLLADRRLERLFLLGRPLLAAGLEPVAADLGQHAGRLLAAHHRDPRIGPREQEPGRVRPTAHRVVTGPERAADHHGQLGH